MRQSTSADGDRSSPWEKTHEAPFSGQLTPIGSKVIFKPSETKQDSPSKMEPAPITGICAGYELAPGCKWNGIYMVWLLEDFAEMELSTKSSSLTRRYRRPRKTKLVALPDEGICFPLKSEYARVNFTLEGVGRNLPSSALELPLPDDTSDTTVRVVFAGVRWVH